MLNVDGSLFLENLLPENIVLKALIYGVDEFDTKIYLGTTLVHRNGSFYFFKNILAEKISKIYLEYQWKDTKEMPEIWHTISPGISYNVNVSTHLHTSSCRVHYKIADQNFLMKIYQRPLYAWSYILDDLELNKDLQDHIKKLQMPTSDGLKPRIPEGSKILFAGRNIRVPDNDTFSLENVDVVILADRLDTGKTGKISITSRDVGQDMPGLPGKKLIIGAKKIINLNVSVPGGKGGTGSDGIEGQKGLDGRMDSFRSSDEELVVTSHMYDMSLYNGSDGGPGTDGHKGGDGGQGGDVTILYYQLESNGRFVIDVTPGNPGKGGNKGIGGTGGKAGTLTRVEELPWGVGGVPKEEIYYTGDEGHKGKDGIAGIEGAVGKQGCQLQIFYSSVTDYWNAIKIYCGKWLEYRLQVGEFFYRRGVSAPSAAFLSAYEDFDAIINLSEDPHSSLVDSAAKYIEQLKLNQNIFGLSRNLDVVVDLDNYRKSYDIFMIGYTGLLAFIQDHFLREHMEQQIITLYETQKTQAMGSINYYKNEMNYATDDINAVADEITNLQSLVEKKKSEIEARKEELENKEIDFFGVAISVFSIGASLATLGTGGAAIVPCLSSLVAVRNILDAMRPSELFDSSSPYRAGLLKQSENVFENFSKIAKGGAAILDIVKVIETLSNSSPNVNEDPQYRQLLAQMADLVNRLLLAQSRLKQSQREFERAGIMVNLSTQCVTKLDSLINASHSTQLSLIELNSGLILLIQNYMDTVARNLFKAIRATEIYTVRDYAKYIRFDYCHIHPDWLVKFGETLVDIEALHSEYVNSFTLPLTNFAMLEAEYQDYSSSTSLSINSTVYKFSIVDLEILKLFRETGKFEFNIPFTSIPATHYEDKFKTIHIGLIGAQSVFNMASLLVTHSGVYSQRDPNGKICVTTLAPRSIIIQATTSAIMGSDHVFSDDINFKNLSGRGIATTWSVKNEEPASLNLDQLKEIQIYVGYICRCRSSVKILYKDGTVIASSSADRPRYLVVDNVIFEVSESDLTHYPVVNLIQLSEAIYKDVISSLPDIPRDGSIFRSDTTDKIFMITSGIKYCLTNEDMRKNNIRSESISKLPDSILNKYPALDKTRASKACRTLYKSGSDSLDELMSRYSIWASSRKELDSSKESKESDEKKLETSEFRMAI